MKQVNGALIEAEEEATPQLQVVAPPNGAGKNGTPRSPMVLSTGLRVWKARPEMAVLGWEVRGQRLKVGK
jgi:hypothetical protein